MMTMKVRRLGMREILWSLTREKCRQKITPPFYKEALCEAGHFFPTTYGTVISEMSVVREYTYLAGWSGYVPVWCVNLTRLMSRGAAICNRLIMHAWLSLFNTICYLHVGLGIVLNRGSHGQLGEQIYRVWSICLDHSEYKFCCENWTLLVCCVTCAVTSFDWLLTVDTRSLGLWFNFISNVLKY